MARRIFSCRNTLRSVWKRRLVTADAPAVLVEGVQMSSDPHQSPFGIKAMGLLLSE
jgi:hypothetical protein